MLLRVAAVAACAAGFVHSPRPRPACPRATRSSDKVEEPAAAGPDALAAQLAETAVARSVSAADAADPLLAPYRTHTLPPEPGYAHTPLHDVHVCEYLSAATCEDLIAKADAHDAWESGRHVNYATTDFPVGDCDAMALWAMDALDETLLPSLAHAYGVERRRVSRSRDRRPLSPSGG